jgi:hypothetical protein
MSGEDANNKRSRGDDDYDYDYFTCDGCCEKTHNDGGVECCWCESPQCSDCMVTVCVGCKVMEDKERQDKFLYYGSNRVCGNCIRFLRCKDCDSV